MRSVVVALALAGAVVLGGRTAHGADGYQLLRLDDHLVKWGSPELGSGATMRYALATNAMHFDGARNCGDIGALDRVIGAAKIEPADFAAEVMAAFAMWQQAAAVTFQPVVDPETADIVIGALANPHGSAFADVFYDRAAEGPVRTIKKALVCLNPDHGWKRGFGGDAEVYDLRYAITHEIGHAIGLDHPGPSGEIMAFAYAEKFRMLQPGDVGGVVALYGKRAGNTATHETSQIVNVSAKTTR